MHSPRLKREGCLQGNISRHCSLLLVQRVIGAVLALAFFCNAANRSWTFLAVLGRSAEPFHQPLAFPLVLLKERMAQMKVFMNQLSRRCPVWPIAANSLVATSLAVMSPPRVQHNVTRHHVSKPRREPIVSRIHTKTSAPRSENRATSTQTHPQHVASENDESVTRRPLPGSAR